jgi:LCP family protein required for cell wall assembly
MKVVNRVIKRWAAGFLLGFFIVTLLGFWAYFNPVTWTHFLYQQAKGRPVGITRVLIFGIDNEGSTKRADSIMLMSIDPKKNRISLLSIPRDTYVNIPGHGMDKINHAHAFGGTALLKKTVAAHFDLTIHHVAKFSLVGIQKLVDDIGGVGVYIEKDLQYKDQKAGLFIDLKKGYQVLNGDKAVQYLRFRHDASGDLGRVARQQQFFYALAKSMMYQNPLNVYQNYKTSKSHIYTTFDAWDMMGLFTHVKDAVASNSIAVLSLPGRHARIKGVSYWVPDNNSELLDLEWDGRVNAGVLTEKRVALTALESPVALHLFSGYYSAQQLYRIKQALASANITVLSVSTALPMDLSLDQTVALVPKVRPFNESVAIDTLYVDPAHVFHYDQKEMSIIIGSEWPLAFTLLTPQEGSGY